jgi:hypothetical protein
MDCFIKKCAHLFHDRRLGGHLYLFFCIQFFKQRVSISLKCDLTSIIRKKFVLANDVYYRPFITIRSRNLHTNDIRGDVGEIISYHEKD